jgi:hypothetical protein
MARSMSRRLVAVVPLLFLGFAPARSADPPGILWETTSKMVMPGVPFSPPPRTMKVCTAAVWTKPPPGGDPSCTSTDYTVTGNTATWTMECRGRMPMKGTGEITFEGTDSYTGAIKATAEGMDMTIELSGKKVGTCDNPQ